MVYRSIGSMDGPPPSALISVALSLTEAPDIFVCGVRLTTEQCSLLKEGFNWNTKRTVDVEDVTAFLDKVSLCSGNDDGHFRQLMLSSRRLFVSRSGEKSAVLDSVNKTVRSYKCSYLIEQSSQQRCAACNRLRACLRVAYQRWLKPQTATARKYTANAFLKTPERKRKFASLAREKQIQNQKVRRLQVKVQKLIAEAGVPVTESLHEDLKTSIEEKPPDKFEDILPSGSFRRLFWEQQKKAFTSKKAKGMRWHQLIIRSALNIKMVSSAAYHAIRSSGFLVLPSERSLRDYSNFFKNKTGFQKEVNDLLLRECPSSEELPSDKHVVIVLDEMKIREDLVFHKNTEEVCGFVDLGKTANQLQVIESSLSKDKAPIPPIATHMLVVMIRGLTTSLRFPYVHFPTKGATALNLLDIFWDTVEQLEMIGLKVIAVSCDGAGPNRKFFRLHSSCVPESVSLCHQTVNPYSKENRNIYFFADVPHLIKTTRNCLSHSFPSSKSRNMQVSFLANVLDLVN